MESTYIQHGVEPNYVLQPDYQFSHNGYGLLQLTANYAVDIATAGSSADVFPRGGEFKGGSGPLDLALFYYGWTVVKAEERGRDGNIAYITVHYAAIANDNDTTETEAVMTSSVVSEPIESHPNFSVIQCSDIGDGVSPLGGKWDGNAPPPLEKPTGTPNPDNKYRALWSTNFNEQTQTRNYAFNGFSPTDTTTTKTANRKAGVRSWMRPSVTMRLTGYTKDAAVANETTRYVGWVTGTGQIGGLEIPASYKGIQVDGLVITPFDISLQTSAGKDWLVTSSNMEVYGGLYKVTVDLLLSGVLGWDRDIYPHYTA